jgi:hypothetical protein
MRVVLSEPAAGFIDAHGGRLYIWMKKNRCCGGGFHTLGTATEPPPKISFRRYDDCSDVELFVPEALGRVPDELHVELRRFPRRVEAYWNGCVFVV